MRYRKDKMDFKSEVKFNKKELIKVIKYLDEYISYRGGMGNRIDAWMIQDKMKNKLKYLEAQKK